MTCSNQIIKLLLYYSVIRFVLYKNYDATSFIINYVGVQIDKQVNSVLQN